MNPLNFFSSLFNVDRYTPHGFCLLWEPELVWMHLVADLTISLAYFSIPVILVYLIRKNKYRMPYSWVFAMFALFILLCGVTHLISIVTLWYPVYYLEGVIKVLTAVASLTTAILLFPLIPTLLEKFQKLEK
jgi:hypothetical protein